MTNGIDWGGTDERVIRAMEAYAGQADEAIMRVAQYLAPQMEAYAKENAAWTDRTANARQALHGYIDDEAPPPYPAPDARPYPSGKLGERITTVYVSHGMTYGFWLEVSNAGRYAIIWPTIEEHMPIAERMLREIFRP